MPKYITLRPSYVADSNVTLADQWTFNLQELEMAITPKTKMLVGSPDNGSHFTRIVLLNICLDCQFPVWKTSTDSINDSSY